MNNDMRKRRRQVAWICFEPHLSEAQLIQAIQMLERSFQLDSVSNLIAYVTKICSEFEIDTSIRKSLYSKFHEMMAEDTDLLIDPLSLIFEQEPSNSVHETKPQAPALTAAQHQSPDAPPHILVFTHFMQHIIDNLSEQEDFFETLMALAKLSKTTTKKLEMPVKIWTDNPTSFLWAEGLNEQMLADLVHLAYTALCELLGPISADDVFHKAIAVCEQKPEARLFPPARFL